MGVFWPTVKEGIQSITARKLQQRKHEVINLSAKSVRGGQTRNRARLLSLKEHPCSSISPPFEPPSTTVLPARDQAFTNVSGGHCKIKPQKVVRTNGLSNQPLCITWSISQAWQVRCSMDKVCSFKITFLQLICWLFWSFSLGNFLENDV